MHTWSEHTAARGSSEVCSPLMKTVLPEYAVEFYNSLTVMGEGVDNENEEDYDEQ